MIIQLLLAFLCLSLGINAENLSYLEAYNMLKELCIQIQHDDALAFKDVLSKDLVEPLPILSNDDKYYPIAKGGYGVIYVNFMHNKVKKVIKQERLEKITSLHTCVNEVKLGQEIYKLGHPMMVQGCDIIADDETKDIYYLALNMDYIQGIDMDDYIDNEYREFGFSDCRRDISFATVLLKQINTLHRRGMMHRDIKPHNIYLEQNEQGNFSKLWLIDFGFASYQEFDDKFKGTDDYAPPEMMAEIRYDKRIDVFSAGATLFDLFIDYTNEDVKDSPCNSTSLFLVMNQMLQLYFDGIDCDKFDKNDEIFANRCRLPIQAAVDYFESLYKMEFDELKLDDKNMEKFIAINRIRVLLPRFSGKGFFGYYYNMIFNEIQHIFERREYDDLSSSSTN